MRKVRYCLNIPVTFPRIQPVFRSVKCGITMGTKGLSGQYQRVPLSESQLNFPGHPYSVSVLKVGYCLPQTDGTFRADGTITLLTGPLTILVDTGGPWDRDFLLVTLKERGLAPGDINLVVGTHGHSDHIGNLSLFPSAVIIVGYDINEGDTYRPNKLAEGQAYCVDEHVSISVRCYLLVLMEPAVC